MPEGTFTTDIAAIHARVRRRVKEGPVTGSFSMLEGAEHADSLADLLGS